MGVLSNKTGTLSNKTGVLSTEMGVLSIETGGRVLESLCFGCSPKGPRQLGGGRGWEWGKQKIPTQFTEQTSQAQPLSARLSACAWQRCSPKAISFGQSQERGDVPTAAQPSRAPPCPCAGPHPSSASPGVTA